MDVSALINELNLGIKNENHKTNNNYDINININKFKDII